MKFEISDAIEDALKTRGLWADFVRRFEYVVEANGFKKSKARLLVLNEIAPDLIPSEFQIITGDEKNKCDDADAVGGDKSGDGVDSCDNGLALKKRVRIRGPRSYRGKKIADDDVDQMVFTGKRCSRSAALDWAFSHQFLAGVSAYDAPSMLAWSLYKLFKISPQAMVGAMKNVFSDDGGGDVGGEGFDGKKEYDLLKTIELGRSD